MHQAFTMRQLSGTPTVTSASGWWQRAATALHTLGHRSSALGRPCLVSRSPARSTALKQTRRTPLAGANGRLHTPSIGTWPASARQLCAQPLPLGGVPTCPSLR